MFVVMKIQDFEVECSLNIIHFKIDTGKMKGFLPVYETKEDALADYPDVPIEEIIKVKK